MCFSHFYPFKEILFITHFRFIIQLNVPQNAKIFLILSNFYLKFIQFTVTFYYLKHVIHSSLYYLHLYYIRSYSYRELHAADCCFLRSQQPCRTYCSRRSSPERLSASWVRSITIFIRFLFLVFQHQNSGEFGLNPMLLFYQSQDITYVSRGCKNLK